MSTPKPRIAIVGLGLVGSSLGLALRQAEVTSTVVGHDRDRLLANEAKSRGAVDRTEWNLISAVEKSDIVILAEPIDAIPATMEAIGPYLRPGCVVMDTAPLKAPVLAWAAEHLPEQVHFVGTNPILPSAASSGSARADLFQRAPICVVPSNTADEASVRLISDLIGILGAQPLFLDAAEHDGLLGGVEHLPRILALALLEMAVQQPSWRELRRVAGSAFESSTRMGEGDAASLSLLSISNRENLLRWIDTYSEVLASLRLALAEGEGEGEALTERIKKAGEERQKWLADQAQGQWQDGPATEMPPRPSLFDAFLGSFWRKRSRKEP
ncbi:MAG: prephenate dehydrogenase [Anaerolineae bacterium]|nr:prephenate dehydrogenase [Anaerolineae bacterium]